MGETNTALTKWITKRGLGAQLAKWGLTPQPGEESSADSWGTIYLHNTSGQDVPLHGVLGLGAPITTPTDDENHFIANRPLFTGELPQLRHAGKIAIALAPVAADGVGEFLLSGVVQTKILIEDEDFQYDYADVDPAHVDRLVTLEEGPAYILWMDSKAEGLAPEAEDVRHALVRISNPVTAFDESSGSSGTATDSSGTATDTGTGTGTDSTGSETTGSETTGPPSRTDSSGTDSTGTGSDTGTGSETGTGTDTGTGSGTGSSVTGSTGSDTGSNTGSSGSDTGSDTGSSRTGTGSSVTGSVTGTSGTDTSGSQTSGSSVSGTGTGTDTGTGSDTGGTDGTGSDTGTSKDTAIVPVDWSPTGYAALYAVEAGDVRFEETMQFTADSHVSWAAIDPRFLSVCAPGTVTVCGCVPNRPVLVGASIREGCVRIEVSDHSEPVELTIRLTGLRKGHEQTRFEFKTREEYEANERRLKGL